MVNDVPAHVGELKRDPVLGLLDSPENILANKLMAVVDRSEPKDLADIWGFCCRMGLSCEAALEGAQSSSCDGATLQSARGSSTISGRSRRRRQRRVCRV